VKVYQYNKFELTFDLSGNWENPFDPEQIKVDGFFTTPGGRELVVPGFFYQDYKKITKDGEDSFKPVDNPVWKIRFTPTEVGNYTYKIKVINKDRELTTEPASFDCIFETSNHGFVRISKTNPLYFEYDDGSPFFAIANCKWWDRMGDNEQGNIEAFYTEFARAGGNMTRNFQMRIGELVDPPIVRPDRGFGKIDLDRSWRHDRSFELCEKIGITHQVSIANGTYFLPYDSNRWNMCVYNVRHGGPFKTQSAKEYFTNPVARENFKHTLRYFIARWGYSTAVFSWNLWNEVDLIREYKDLHPEAIAWHREMAEYIEQIDWADHVVHTIFKTVNGSPALDSLSEMDIVSVNTYTSMDFAPSAEYWIKRHISDYKKPVMFSEFGIGHSFGPEGYSRQDPLSIMAHNGMWSCLMSGSASTGMAFGWQWLRNEHYFNYVNAISTITESVPFNKRDWKPVSVRSLTFKEKVRQPYYTDKFLEGWHMNYRFPEGWEDREVFNVEKNGKVEDHTYMSGFLGAPLGRDDITLNLDYPVDGDFTIFIPEIFLRKQSPGMPEFTVYLDGNQIIKEKLANEDDNFRELNKEFKVKMSAGKHSIKLANTGGGYFPMGYKLTNYVHKDGPDLEVRGLQSEDMILLWLKSPKFTWLYEKMGIYPGQQPSGKLILNNVPEGIWVAEWIETVDNKWIQRASEKSESGKLILETPPILNSVAVRLTKLDN